MIKEASKTLNNSALENSNRNLLRNNVNPDYSEPNLSTNSKIWYQEAKVSKYMFLGIIYLISVVSSSIANLIGTNVQSFYRVPVLNLRWIDISILLILFSYFYNLFSTKRRLKNDSNIVFLCFIYLIFEAFQLYRSWGLNDFASQTSHFLCTLSLFIVIDLSTYELPIEKIVSFLKKFAILGACVVIISNIYLLYSFVTGHVVYEDLDIRVALEVVGSKETVYPFVLTPFVYAFGLYFVQKPGKYWKKILFLFAILSIYGSLAVTFHRGTLITVLAITVYFLLFSADVLQAMFRMVGIFIFIGLGYLIFGGTLAKKGYDPIQKILQTAKFTTDVNNPEWDKGRSLSQEYAIDAWQKNIWFGAGYDELIHYGLPEGVATAHNGIITSLFHRGIVGTIILILILVLLFKYAIKLWFLLNREKLYENEMMKLLVLVSFFWIITFMTQEALWEKYSLSIELTYLGLIYNYYKQLIIRYS